MLRWALRFSAVCLLILAPALAPGGDVSFAGPAGIEACGESWSDTSLVNAPSARSGHTAVWTGATMIVWGGGAGGGNTNSGAIYDPALDSWTPTALVGAPQARSGHTAVWTGTEMIVFGGTDAGLFLASGARYDPLTDTWTSIADAPTVRSAHTAIWTGTRMLVWGGQVQGSSALCEDRLTSSGSVYDPATDTWSAMAASPLAPRAGHTAVWTGGQMVVWGGYRLATFVPPVCHEAYFADGARFDPLGNAWTALPPAGLAARAEHVAVWTGGEMVVWGGLSRVSFPLPPVTTTYADGAGFAPASNTWSPIAPASAPAAGARGVWTGGWMIVWGGSGSSAVAERWNRSSDTWSPTTAVGAPTPRGSHTAVWSGSSMIVFGGAPPPTATGGVYDPGAFEPDDDDGDGWPASCDPCLGDAGNDPDGDTVCAAIDNCPQEANASQADQDADDIGDDCDNCVVAPNAEQTDADFDGWGDACDNCPAAGNASQADADLDARGDACDNCVLDANADQTDSDLDSFGDVCDNCPTAPNVSQVDADSDGHGNACDNCPQTANSVQGDEDADGRGDRCDNCPAAANASQTDTDLDGRGDVCDCQPLDPSDFTPGEVTGVLVSRSGPHTAELTWTPVAHADAYSVARADLAALASGDYGSCLANDVRSTAVGDAGSPAAGAGVAYLVQAQNDDCGLGTLGRRSDDIERVDGNGGGCSGRAHVDAHASGQSTIAGSASGTLADTLSSDDAALTVTEELSGGGPPATRFSLLEQRFTVPVAAGSLVELHLEAWQSTSPDGDQFAFEYSTDDGSTWSPIVVQSWPGSDPDSDGAWALPAGLSGAVLIRVLDTNRTPGNQALDTLAIDELFVRTVTP